MISRVAQGAAAEELAELRDAGITIVDALAVATVSLPLAVLFACLAPVLRFWQRWVAAT